MGHVRLPILCGRDLYLFTTFDNFVRYLRSQWLRVVYQADIRVALWEKFLFICAFSGVTALTRLPLGQVFAYPETSRLLTTVLKEGEAVARASEIALPDGIVERSYATLQALEPEAMGSMAFDLLAGRRLELEALNGTMVRLGHELGLSLPFNFAIYAALKPYANGALR